MNEKVIEGLQAIVTGLSQQSTGHEIEALLFAEQGYNKLAQKYKEHAEEERQNVIKCAQRIIDLGGTVQNQTKPEAPVYADPEEWLKYDHQVSIDGLAWLKGIVEEAREDYATFRILEDYYIDEEEDLNWETQQLDLIEKIGKQNWLVTLL